MRYSKQSTISGKVNTMDLPITPAQIHEWQRGGGYIQEVFPQLDANQREFLISGSTPEEWEELFGPEPEEPESGIQALITLNALHFPHEEENDPQDLPF